jgi:hypothetical protein
MPLSLDEVAVNVVQTMDLDRSPFRQTGRSFRLSGVRTPTVAQFVSFGIRNLGTKPFVIEEFWIYMQGGASVVYAGLGGIAAAAASTSTGATGELANGGLDQPPLPTLSIERNANVVLNQYDTVGSQLGAISSPDYGWTFNAGSLLFVPNLDVTVYPPLSGQATDYVVANTTPTTALACGCRIRVYD